MSTTTPIILSNIIQHDDSICFDSLGTDLKTIFICITGQSGSGKTTLRNNLATELSKLNNIVVIDNYLNNDEALNNYMVQLDGKCNFFICENGPINLYSSEVAKTGKSYSELYSIQRPENLVKFDIYIHLNCSAKIALKRLYGHDRKKHLDYLYILKREFIATKQLFANITLGKQKELEFLRDAKHFYWDTSHESSKIIYEAVYNTLKIDSYNNTQ